MSRQDLGKVVFGVLGIAGSLALIASIGYAIWYTDQLRVGPPDYCPTGTGPQEKAGFVVPGHTAILIDTSDEIPPSDADRAFQRINAWTRNRNAVPFLQRLSIYGLPESAYESAAGGHDSWCIPKTGEEINRIYENPVYVEAQFRRFLATLQGMFKDLVDREEAAHSPILETMAHLVRRDTTLNSIVLVSDMLQHTLLWSHYTREGDTAGISSTCSQVRGEGRLKKVFVYYIDRGLPEIQPPEWPDPWWRECLRGVELVEMN